MSLSIPQRVWLRLIRLDAHHRLFVATGIAAGAAVLLPGRWSSPTRLLTIWLVYSFLMTGLCWVTIAGVHPRQMRNRTPRQDMNRLLIFGFVITAALISLLANIILLRSMNVVAHRALLRLVGLSVLAVISSWGLVHTVFALRYAHLYYGNGGPSPGGLSFPGSTDPDYVDFAYFSFGIGMTSQVADVVVTTTRMRGLVLLHSVLSFSFNVVIIAFNVSIISSIG